MRRIIKGGAFSFDRKGLIRAAVAAVFAALVLCPIAAAKEIPLLLRIEPELKVEGTEKIYVGPILLEPRSGAAKVAGLDVIAPREFDRYLRRILRRETRLTVLDPLGRMELPTGNPHSLLGIRPFWRDLGRRVGAEYIVTAAIDVEILDRAGYQTEEYVSPADGKTYFRQVLIEETGFKYDILVTVLEGNSGKQVFQEQITDFQEKSQRKLEVYTDMFNDLYTLDNRLLAIFVPRFIRAKRYLFK